MRHEPGDGVDERRLAGAVGADQADQFAGLDVEVDIDNGVHAAKRDGDTRVGENTCHPVTPLMTCCPPPSEATGAPPA